MNVSFYKGVIRETPGEISYECWAETPYGTMVCSDQEALRVGVILSPHIECADPVTTVDLTGVNLEGLEVLVANILCGGYLDKPGVRNSGESVLYILVNEALHQMEWIRKKELSDPLAD